MATGSGSDRLKSGSYQSSKESPPGSFCRPLVPGIQPLEGGHAEEFVRPVDDKYKCEQCHLVLCNARQTGCGHRFCETCLDTLLRFPCHVCPADQEALDGTEVFNDNCCRKEVLGLIVYCRNNKLGCKQQIALGALEAHLNTCPFQQIQCSRASCSELVLRRDLSDHLSCKCKYREVKCKYCQKETTLADLKTHESSGCPSLLITCPKNCGPRVHRAEGTSRQTKEYEIQSAHQLLLPVLLKNKALEEKVSALENEMKEKMTALPILSSQFQQMEKAMSLTSQSVNRSDIKLNQSQKTLAVHTDKLYQVDRELLERRKLEENLKRDILLVKFSAETVASRVSSLENGQSTPCLYRGNSGPASVEHQVGQHDNMLSVHEVRLAEIDLRFQLLETASYNGRLIWKIRDYARRKREAVSGTTLSLYSQPFYTGSFGYKMCARVYLNGDGMGKGTHLSLFFVVMRSEYDPLLPWPFKQKVTLSLLDQGPAKEHVSDTFKPDPNSSSFRRPQMEMNVASGCPLFMTQTVLENETHRYVKDDTIFIRITVETTDTLEL